jgi:hypothetical protein
MEADSKRICGNFALQQYERPDALIRVKLGIIVDSLPERPSLREPIFLLAIGSPGVTSVTSSCAHESYEPAESGRLREESEADLLCLSSWRVGTGSLNCRGRKRFCLGGYCYPLTCSVLDS